MAIIDGYGRYSVLTFKLSKHRKLVSYSVLTFTVGCVLVEYFVDNVAPQQNTMLKTRVMGCFFLL